MSQRKGHDIWNRALQLGNKLAHGLNKQSGESEQGTVFSFVIYRNERSRRKPRKLSGGRFKKRHKELLFHTCIHKL